MSNIHQLHEHAKIKQQQMDEQEQLIEQASDWVAKLDRTLTQQEQSQLKKWLAQSPSHLNALLEVAKLWDKMEDLTRLSDLFPKSGVRKTQSKPWSAFIAASLFIIASLGFYHVQTIEYPSSNKAPDQLSAHMQYKTQVGQTNSINLPDNSTLVLNTDSIVKVKYSQHTRIIELLQGEIHIDVAHDKLRPLSVIAGGKVIQAVGTAFNVEVRDELIELIVTDGKVLVAQTSIKPNQNNLDTLGKKLPIDAMAITKGEKVDLDLTGKKVQEITKVDPVDVAASLSWQQGNLIFRGESIDEVMAEISRYTDIEFELVEHQALRNVKVAGMFKTGDVDGLLNVLSRNFKISHQKISNDKIILSYAG